MTTATRAAPAHQQAEAIRLLIEGQTQADVAKLMGVNQTTISAIWVKYRDAPAEQVFAV